MKKIKRYCDICKQEIQAYERIELPTKQIFWYTLEPYEICRDCLCDIAIFIEDLKSKKKVL